MPDETSLEDLIEFLNHAGERGLMPAATAQALAVASRNVFSVLDDSERARLPMDDIDAVIKRFTNKRAKDFNPTSLKEYGRRVKRAVELYLQWRSDPANFSVRTRTTTPGKRKTTNEKQTDTLFAKPLPEDSDSALFNRATGYQTAFPVRAGQVVTVSNIPYDLSSAEADRLAMFIRMLAGSDAIAPVARTHRTES
ncbi:MAG: hypothetical protein ACREMS_00990 [Gemmatimonadaceae bacterium]